MKWGKPLTFLVVCKHFLRRYYLFKLKTRSNEETKVILIKSNQPVVVYSILETMFHPFIRIKQTANLTFSNVTVFTFISTNNNVNNFSQNTYCLGIILGFNAMRLLSFKVK